MNNIFVAAHPRSGSTFFCGLLHSFSELKVYFEIFHSDINVIKRHLHGDYEIVREALNTGSDEISKNVILKNTGNYLQVLAEHNPDKRIVYKVFPGHLPQENLKVGLFSSSVVVILHRNLLHSFISDCIATEMQRWANVDTSERKIHFSEERFIQHVKRVVSFYDQIRSFSHNKTLVEINYEQLISVNSPLIELQKTFEHINLSLILDEKKTKKFKLQDHRIMAGDKVSNPEELLHFLTAYNLRILNNSRTLLPDNVYSPLL